MSDQDETARRMAFFQQLAQEAAAAGPQDECDNPTAPATATPASDRATAPQRSPWTRSTTTNLDGATPAAGDTLVAGALTGSSW